MAPTDVLNFSLKTGKKSSKSVPHAKVGKSQVHQANEVHHGKDDGAGRGVLPDELIEQQAGCADKYKDERGGFEEVSHLNVDYNMMQQIVQSEAQNSSSVD